MQPPWSTATSTMIAPSRMREIMARTSRVARPPGSEHGADDQVGIEYDLFDVVLVAGARSRPW